VEDGDLEKEKVTCIIISTPDIIPRHPIMTSCYEYEHTRTRSSSESDGLESPVFLTDVEVAAIVWVSTSSFHVEAITLLTTMLKIHFPGIILAHARVKRPRNSIRAPDPF
jgi:hypothetical protein